MATFIDTMRSGLYYAVILCGTCYFTSCVFRLVDAIERPTKRKKRGNCHD